MTNVRLLRLKYRASCLQHQNDTVAIFLVPIWLLDEMEDMLSET